jgi:ABC-type glycerol-3-phosphate transport system permease component
MSATTSPPTSSTPVVPPLRDRTNARNVHRARPAARRQDREPVAFAVRILLYVVYGLPLIWIVLTSLKRQGDVVGGSIFTAPSFDAYREALANPSLLTALSQSAQIAAGTTALVLVFGAPFAYALRRIDGRLTGLVLGLLIFLQMVPQTANIIPLFAIFSRLRLLDTTVGLIIADTAMLLPWAILLLRPFFAAVPDAIEEAASLDGAGRLRTYVSVVLPIVRNGLATVGSLIFLVAWGEFLYAINLFVSPVNYPISALIAQQTSGYGIDWPGLMSLAVISSIPLLVVYVLSFRLLREGLSVGSVK